ncbi:hypothetical protein GOV12_07345, partial [Candidatus Pacearchaeota archaeon]|nr:hypothetical protein [Candidatus Pacearchaeota archaeon]
FRKCVTCKRPAKNKFLITWFCDYCKKEIVNMEGTFNNRKKSKCPDCRKDLIEVRKTEILTCDYCKTNSNKNPELFDEKEGFATEKLIEADIILVAPRHLFRMPYSLHEKTALASIVIDKDKIKDFQITDAKSLKVEIKDYYPKPKPDEARELLLQALDWAEEKERKEKIIEERKSNIIIPDNQKPNYNKKDNKEFNTPKITNPNDEIFPPCIKAILKGIKGDGKKRALFILLNFLKTIGVEDKDIEKRIYEWNEKNEYPLKKGYIMSQLSWQKRNSSRMPPNCTNPMYMDLQICNADDLCKIIKNPINYAFKKFFKKG